MAFDRIWDAIHRTRTWGKYPNEHLVRWVARKYFNVPQRYETKFLDLGCGAGANTWFLRCEGFWVAPVDGSVSALRHVDGGVAADAIRLPFASASFDCVVDIVCIAHHFADMAGCIIDEAARVLKPGGCIFSVMPTNECSEAPYAGKGAVLFAEGWHLPALFNGHFNIEVNRASHTDGPNHIDHWLISGTKVTTGA
jgi:SAM-dependent methyltransferase